MSLRAWALPMLVLFGLPVFAVAFFAYAPGAVETKLHANFETQIQKLDLGSEEKARESATLSALDFREVCASTTSRDQEIVNTLGLQTTCREFQIFTWLEWLALALIAVGGAHIAASALLARWAERSRQSLINAFRTGWSSTIAFVFVVLIGQTVLAVASCFFLTVLLTRSYFPKLLLMFALGGAWALYQVARLLIQKMPFEMREVGAEAIDEARAPELWSDVRALASALETAAPDTILVGQSSSFYVTEARVLHTGGWTHGRTLYLSGPLMRHMPIEELKAVIGHELGHFKGEDTKLSREFSPRFRKAGGTIDLLSQSGLMGWPAIQIVSVYLNFLYPVVAKFNRSREIEADRAGSAITSPASMSRSLVRVHYLSECLDHTLHRAVSGGQHLTQIPDDILASVQENDQFWSSLGRSAVTHPVDSHPPLFERLSALGESRTNYKLILADAGADAGAHGGAGGANAHDLWLGAVDLSQSHGEFAEALQSHSKQIQMKSADADSLEGEAILAGAFPRKVWRPHLGKALGLAVLTVLVCGAISALAFMIKDPPLAMGVFSGGVLASLILGFVYFNHLYKQDLTIDHRSLMAGQWSEPLLFTDIQEMRAFSNNGVTTLQLTFKNERAPLSRNAWFKDWFRKSAKLQVAHLRGGQRQIVETIFKYYTRTT